MTVFIQPTARRSVVRCMLQAAALPVAAVLAGCASTPPATQAAAVAPSSAAGGTVTVVLSDFAFTPSDITLRAGVPVRLRLENQSSGGHNFSAPAFFAASAFPPGATAPADGKIEVAAHQTVEVALTPTVPGTYPLECTHFLHAMFGMTGTIKVVS